MEISLQWLLIQKCEEYEIDLRTRDGMTTARHRCCWPHGLCRSRCSGGDDIPNLTAYADQDAAGATIFARTRLPCSLVWRASCFFFQITLFGLGASCLFQIRLARNGLVVIAVFAVGER